MPQKEIIFGLATIIIGVISYALYFRGIIRGRIRPDPFSWLIWGVLAAIAFFAQLARGGGPGTWATALTALACLAIAVFSYANHDGRPKSVDILSLLGAAVGLAAWYFTQDPLWAVIFTIIVGALGFVPTFAKSFYKPSQEAGFTYLLNACKFVLAIFALQSLNLTTVLYPAAMAAMNFAFVGMLAFHRVRGGPVRWI